MGRIYSLTAAESERLKRAIAGCLVNPFIDDILDFNWEAVWHYCKGLTLPDPLTKTRKKYLHDAIDHKRKIGWSLKTQQISCPISDCKSYAVVIARADIFGRADRLGFPGLSVKSRPEDLARAVLKIWGTKVQTDKKIQNVRESRMATLLKAPRRTEFAVHETDLEVYDPRDLKWVWGKNGKGFWALEKKTKRQVYRWYPSGGQLFEIFQVPPKILSINLEWRRLDAERVLGKLEELTGSLEHLVDERRKR